MTDSGTRAGALSRPGTRTAATIAIVAIMLLAWFLRLYQLNLLPPGMYYDEGYNGRIARDIERGTSRPIYIQDGEEPLLLYLGGGLFALAGEKTWSLRLAAVVLGLLLIPALYFAARALFPRKELLALVAAFIGATLYWAITLNRVTWQPDALPGILALSAGALAVAYSSRSLKWSIGAGLLLGLTFYTYVAARLWPLILIIWVAYLFVIHRGEALARWRLGLVYAVIAFAVVSPLAFFFFQDPRGFFARSTDVLQLGSLGANTLFTAGMIFVTGDMNPRDNLPGRPLLDPFLALLFIVGLVVSLRRWKQPSYFLLILWLIVMLVPSALTEDAPNYRRTTGAMPALALLCAIGADSLWGLGLGFRGRYSQIALPAILALGLVYSTWSSVHTYFVDWAQRTDLYYAFDQGLYDLAHFLAARPADQELYLTGDYHEHYTVLYVMDGRPFISFEQTYVAVLKPPAVAATYGIFIEPNQPNVYRQYFPQAQLLRTLYDKEGQPYVRVLYIPAGVAPRINPQEKLDARLGQTISLLGYDIGPADQGLGLALYWQAEGKVDEDYTTFIHLLGPTNLKTGSTVWAEADGQPGNGTYPTSRWLPGQIIVDHYYLKVPDQSTRQTYQLEVGMYLLATGRRLPALMNGELDPESRLVLGPVTH
jgi:4-amino-4-deoxy-L-arabinose transferase-like glycosyltransferase